MKYLHILSAFAAEPLAMQPEKIREITAFLMLKAEGGELSAEERAAKITNKASNDVAKREGAIAVVPVYGVLAQRMNMMAEFSGGTSYSLLKQQVMAALASDEVKAVVLDIDSPGGAVPGTVELSDFIRSVRGGAKPIIAQVNSLAASAAYWIATSADEIVVTPSGRAGSIGVYTSHDDISAFLEQKGVKRTYIAAGKYKVEGNETSPLDEEARSYVQSLIDQSYDAFVSSVAEGRGVTRSKVLDGFGQGRIFGAQDLVDRGMADRVATLDETLQRFGAQTEPEAIRKMRAASGARAEAAETLVSKIRAGAPVTKREFEHGLKGLAGLSNSEAERAARLYFKDDQGDPDAAARSASVLKALRDARAKAEAFSTT
jgi:signal peptide peptidase SppA